MATAVKTRMNKKTTVIIVALIVAVALTVTAICLSEKSREREIEYFDFQKDVAAGIDVSEHNGEIDWDKVSDSVDFAFIRVGYRGYGSGKNVEDKYAKENLKGAQKSGIPFGVYFYSQAVSEEEAREEAKFVLKKIRHHSPNLPIVIDFEYPTDEYGAKTGRLHNAYLSREENTGIINAFCEEIQEGGYASGVYASSSVLAFNIDTDSLNKDIMIWVADYNSQVGYGLSYKMWQYSRAGSCDGISSKNVDFNYYYSKTQKGN
ncbi:MAG: glycoside hydrolase family 25 protein [Eubacteriales bacterium]|nr:glycoside hydrolase family 25 protein [Eubacteriales bacterium]